MKNVAVILAAGSGSRFASDIPKQYVKIQGKMIIEHTIEAFQRHPFVDEIMIAVQPLFAPLIELIKKEEKYNKLTSIIIGGKERYDTTLSIINHCEGKEECNLLLHDAVRPFIDQNTISDVITALHDYEAVVVATPAIDTILEVNDEQRITAIPDRKRLWNAQTPQAFRLSTLRSAFEKGVEDPNFHATDDSSVVFRYLPQTSIHIIAGLASNMKITYSEDVEKLEGK
ncbi:MAG: 2-C-methyl-D-erythritol 4-phosphate cytidylyltransferase [Bacteroidales bacterium]|nr:2-C-methyl-D-erythritol 4-phosphate cytidylyltransferase [Bacteroidales bacterium]